MLRVDPITFEVVGSNYTASQKIKQELEKLKKEFLDLRDFNNFLLEAIKKLDDLPADTRFPGFFSSLYDHAVLTSAIAVSIALDLRRKGIDFSTEYDGKLSEMLKDENSLIEVVRCASLLHDIGKQPPQGHYLRTRESVEEILKIAGFEAIAKEIAECASRHHYREEIDEEYKPKTKLEWVIAIADKVAVVDRGVMPLGDEFVQIHEWILKKLDGSLSEDSKGKLIELIEFKAGKRKELQKEEPILPLDMDRIQILDRIIFNPKEVFGAEPKVGVLSLETAGIQRFVTASDFRKYVSGASVLLENVLYEIKNYLQNRFCPECVIYAKGGSLLAIVPADYYDDLKENIVRRFKERTKVVFPKIPPKKFFVYKLSELKYGPSVLWNDKRFVYRRNFGSTVSKTLNFLETEENLAENYQIAVGEICRCCYEFPAGDFKIVEDGEELWICERCNLVLEEHERNKEMLLFSFDLEKQEVEKRIEKDFWKKLIERFEERIKNSKIVAELLQKGVKKVNFKSVITWNHLGRQHFSPLGEEEEGVYDIAFVKGDGDNFGKIKEGASSPTLFREISRLFENLIEGSTIEAFVEILMKELRILNKLIGEKASREICTIEIPFDVVFIGGDDFLVLMDSAFVFTFLKTFRESVQKLLGERKEKYEKEAYQRLSIFPLGVSIGVAIVKNRAPIKSTFETLNDMVKKSKELSKKETETKKFGSEIYIHMQKFEQIPTKDEIESLSKFTSFPLTGKEFINFLENLKFFAYADISHNWIKRVFGEEKPTSQTEACINLLFKMARTNKDSEEFRALEKLYQLHEKFEIKEDFRYKHIDIAEAVRILKEKVWEKIKDENRREIVKILIGD